MSVHALTIKDGYNYNDAQQNTNLNTVMDEAPKKHKYAPGYNEKDDLNHDGVIDQVETYIKITGIKEDIKDAIDDRIKEDYLKKFRKEVDFHHKVAYRYEKAYRLGKNLP